MSLYGAYKAGKTGYNAIYAVNKARLGGAVSVSTVTTQTGAGRLGANAGSIKSKTGSMKSVLSSALDSKSGELKGSLSNTSSQFDSVQSSNSNIKTTTIGSMG